MSEVTYEIKKRIGVIAERENGWKRELNLVSWNGGPFRFDLREWDAEHTRMSRGISMSEDEFRKLIDLGKDWQ